MEITLEKQLEYRKKWVEALRSGEYLQNRSALASKDLRAFCCLGVLCDLVKDEVGGEWQRRPERGRRGYCDLYIDTVSSAGILPEAVRKLVGLTDREGSFRGGYYAGETLASLNDNNSSFSEIAGIIESAPEGLFVETQA